MSDVYCTKCGEPWELDSLHEAAKDQGHTFGEILAGFRVHGCSALSGSEWVAVSVPVGVTL